MIKNRLRIILAEQDLKMSDLVRMTGLNATTIAKIYHNTFKDIKLDTINRICNALEVPIQALFEYTPD